MAGEDSWRDDYNREARRVRPPRPLRGPLAVIHGYVRDAGGGVVTVVVARDTESYPATGAVVVMVVEHG